MSLRKCLLVLLFAYWSPAGAVSLDAVNDNNEAVDRMKVAMQEMAKLAQDKEYEPTVDVEFEVFRSYQKLVGALQKEPFEDIVHFNLGMAYELNKEAPKALKQYLGLIKRPGVSAQMKFAAAFNAGNVAARSGNIDQALGLYQQALDMVGGANQELSNMVRVNIELVWMQQQGQGKGEDENKDKNKDGEGEGEGEGEDPDNPEDKNYSNKQQNKQPKPFESRELTENDVRKILDELKKQEQKIRAKEYSKNIKDKPRGKDW